MKRAIIAVGSNIEAKANTAAALVQLARLGKVMAQAPWVWTKPQGYLAQDNFRNGAVALETGLEQSECVRALKQIEQELGRVRTENKAGPCPIDLDLVVWDQAVVDTDYIHHSYLRLPIHAIADQVGLLLSPQQSSDAVLCEKVSKRSAWILDEKAMIRTIRFVDFSTALGFINQVGELAEQVGHHPDLRLFDYQFVEIQLSTHSASGLTEADVLLAEQIDGLID